MLSSFELFIDCSIRLRNIGIDVPISADLARLHEYKADPYACVLATTFDVTSHFSFKDTVPVAPVLALLYPGTFGTIESMVDVRVYQQLLTEEGFGAIGRMLATLHTECSKWTCPAKMPRGVAGVYTHARRSQGMSDDPFDIK
jgi:hypothetical protein